MADGQTAMTLRRRLILFCGLALMAYLACMAWDIPSAVHALALVLSVCGGAWGQTSWWSLTSDSDLLIRWNGDANNDGTGDTEDASGNGHHLTRQVGAYSDFPAGKGEAGKAITNLRGYVAAPIASEPTTGWTIRAWLRRTSVMDSNSVRVFARSDGINNSAFDPLVRVRYNAAGHRYDMPGLETANGSSVLDTWQLVHFVMHSNGDREIYIDGVLANTASDTYVPIADNGYTWAINQNNHTNGWDARNGLLTYDQRIYSKAITGGEAAEDHAGPEPHYTSGATLTVRQSTITGSVGNWDDYDNGTITFEWKVLDEDFNEIASGTGDTINATGLANLPGLYTLHVRATNNGDYDVGDGLDGLGGGNGYYKVAEFRRYRIPKLGLQDLGAGV